MDYHKNAPWTAVSRERLARLVIEDGLSASAAALRFTVSAKTAAKWVPGISGSGLENRKSGPAARPLLSPPTRPNVLTMFANIAS